MGGNIITPVLLIPDGPMLPTEAGKLWIENTNDLIDKHDAIVRDVLALAEAECARWEEVNARIAREVDLTAISSGVSKSQMQALINASTKNAVYSAPSVFVAALCTAAPTSSSTGASITEAAYTGYARTAVTMGAASNADPSIATNSGAVTFPACTGGTSTLVGYIMADNATTGAGASLWYGTLTSTTISTTQTPPTFAIGALSASMTGS